MPLFWFHSPDVRQGQQKDVKGVLQFVQDSNQRLHYRAFSNRDQGFAVEKTGVVEVDGPEIDIWGKMEWKFRVPEYFTQAKEEDRFLPPSIKPGKETEMDRGRFPPAICFRLRVGGTSKEFWVMKESSKTVEVEKRVFTVAFKQKEKQLPFEIKLERAEQTVDPGTRAAATYTSFVRLYDKEL